MNLKSIRLNGRYSNRVAAQEYSTGSLKRQSYGSSQSKTPNPSIYEGFTNGFSPKNAHTSPNFHSTQKDAIGSSNYFLTRN